MSSRLATAELGGATEWFNTEPLGPAELRGRVVLVNFWTLTCINWLRTLPYIRAWSRVYRDDGLVVIGVHTPEFTFEHDVALVRDATRQRDIDYPVAVDNEYAIWSAFANRYWPALYFVEDGRVREHYFGEGRYEQSERLLQQMLGVERDVVPVHGAGVEAPPDWEHLRTPETYLGYGRTDPTTSPRGAFDRPAFYQASETLPADHWALDGDWTMEHERVVLNRPDGAIDFRFHARDVHAVVSHHGGTPVPFRVQVDGQVPGASHGEDVAADGTGLLHEGRLYQLFRANGTVLERTLQVTFGSAGVEVYAFTFG